MGPAEELVCLTLWLALAAASALLAVGVVCYRSGARAGYRDGRRDAELEALRRRALERAWGLDDAFRRG